MSNAYSLLGPNAARAVQAGLAEADWYQSPVPREVMRSLLERRDGPAIRDTLLWFGLLGATGAAGFLLWGTWWAILPFLVYGVLYASTSDSRWHESSHGTAFKTDWMNNALYEIASFMVMRESVCWRWSHARHHSDTIIVGRDPEIAVPRPPTWLGFLGAFISLQVIPAYFARVLRHAAGCIDPAVATYVPASEFPKIFWRARIYLAIYAAVVVAALATQSLLPLMYIGLPTLYGSWLMPIYGYTQHAGLAENVLDHRLNCRTVRMNWLNRYLYWNMNYHIEHHMFPLVPYHALPRLHDAVRDDMPRPYDSILAAFREIIPAVRRQMREPTWFVKREVPPPRSAPEAAPASSATTDAEGWIQVGPATLPRGQVQRFDHGRHTYAIYHTEAGAWHATAGICTHGNAYLAEGLVVGTQIECPKHNGRFHLQDGAPARPPVCRALPTYALQERSGVLWLNPRPAGAGAREPVTHRLRVVANRQVATFITELVLEPVEGRLDFTPGDYLQLNIPAYGRIAFADLAIAPAWAPAWEGLRGLVARNDAPGRRNNYSIASIPADGRQLRFNVRIALPPAGSDAPPGIGSAWVFALKPGDAVTAVGPFGDFHIKPTQREMVYIGGGAGMAPIRAHLGALLGGDRPSDRRISFWYGARSRSELFYQEELTALARDYANFTYVPALSDPRPDDAWDGPVGFIHQVALDRYLATHPNPGAIEFYLCGPPPMIAATTAMLERLGVRPRQVAYDEF